MTVFDHRVSSSIAQLTRPGQGIRYSFQFFSSVKLSAQFIREEGGRMKVVVTLPTVFTQAEYIDERVLERHKPQFQGARLFRDFKGGLAVAVLSTEPEVFEERAYGLLGLCAELAALFLEPATEKTVLH